MTTPLIDRMAEALREIMEHDISRSICKCHTCEQCRQLIRDYDKSKEYSHAIR